MTALRMVWSMVDGLYPSTFPMLYIQLYNVKVALTYDVEYICDIYCSPFSDFLSSAFICSFITFLCDILQSQGSAGFVQEAASSSPVN